MKMEEIMTKVQKWFAKLRNRIFFSFVGCFLGIMLLIMGAVSYTHLELEAIAAAKGIAISKAAASSGHGSAVPPSARYSTLQDLDAVSYTHLDVYKRQVSMIAILLL